MALTWRDLRGMMLGVVQQQHYEDVTLRAVTSAAAFTAATGARAKTIADTVVKANRGPVRVVPGPGGAGVEREWPIVINRVQPDGSELATPPREGHRIVLDAGTAAELELTIATVGLENGGDSYRLACRRVKDNR